MEVTVTYVLKEDNKELGSKDLSSYMHVFNEVAPAVKKYRDMWQKHGRVFNLEIGLYKPGLSPDDSFKILENEFEKQSAIPQIINMCLVKTNYETADFWLVRKNSANKVGMPTKEYKAEHIGVKVREEKKESLDPEFLFYWFTNFYNNGGFQKIARGTTKLKNITIADVNYIQLSGENHD